jgi:hypothetical protein
MSPVVLAALALVVGQAVVPPPAPASAPALQIAIRTFRADGTETGWASLDGADRFSGYLAVDDSLCGVRAGPRESSGLEGIGWQISGQIVRQTGDDVTAKVDWARAWEHGERVQNGPRGSTEISMRVGDHVALDSVLPFKEGGCNKALAQLDATIIMKQPWQLRGAGGGGSSGVGRAVAGTGKSVLGAGSRAVAVAPSGGEASGSQNSGIAPLTTEMWLVHQRPEGTEEALRQVIPTTTELSEFNFAPISVATSRGRVTVALTGTLQLVPPGVTAGKGGSVASGVPQLRIAMDRRVIVEGAPPGGSRGRSMMELALPNASEVIAFELPPLRNSERDVFEGHQFSLRLRVTAAK